jgi:hypothetical protein
MSETGERLRDLFTEIAPPIDVEEIVRTTRAPARLRRGWQIAVAAAAGVLVGGIGTFLLFSGAPKVDDSAMSAPAPSTTAVPPTTVSPVTTSGVSGVSAVPGGWCGIGSPPESVAPSAGESVAWAPDGSKWGIWTFPPNAGPNFELRQHLPDGSVVPHPAPAIEDFDLPPWTLQGLEGVGEMWPGDLEITADGQVWLSNSVGWGWGPIISGVLRYDPESSTWENIEMVPGRTVPVNGIEATCDGSLWVLVIDWTPGDDGLEGWWLAHIDAEGVITRIDVDLLPGTVPEVVFAEFPDAVDGPPAVIRADDRAVWVTNGLGFPTVGRGVFSGVARYDGEKWTRFLDGELVGELTLNDDGTATTDGGVLIEP